MANGTRVDISPSLQEKIDSLGELAEDSVAKVLLDISETLTDSSPVDTGAFVTSWSLSNKNISRRSYSSKGLESAPLKRAKRQEALGELIDDLKGLRRRWSFKDNLEVSAGTFYFVNGAPHAAPVNKVHAVIAKARRKHG